MKRFLKIIKIDDARWRIEGRGLIIVTDTEEKAKEWKKLFEGEDEPTKKI